MIYRPPGFPLSGPGDIMIEAEVGLEVLGDLTDETLEGELAEEELGGLLVPTDLAESKSKSETCNLHAVNNKEAASMQQL